MISFNLSITDLANKISRTLEELEHEPPNDLVFETILQVLNMESTSLLKAPTKHCGPCYCPPDTCQAPIIMGQQMPCQDPKRPYWDKFKI